eukprot:TRINITY_DN45947_c0_g1_i1.p2 TRINITY_DN45947_c0_g1~~TRINITY_DN45947_c0_g1_i1.p2  ORF type:complete len:118 (-),score=10.27 TRINITY_DN45947_c0_g1_i1:206-508(-)
MPVFVLVAQDAFGGHAEPTGDERRFIGAHERTAAGIDMLHKIYMHASDGPTAAQAQQDADNESGTILCRFTLSVRTESICVRSVSTGWDSTIAQTSVNHR